MSAEDDRVSQLLQEIFPSPQMESSSRDLWPLVQGRLKETPRLSWVDLGLAGLATIGLLAFPGSFLLIAYHL